LGLKNVKCFSTSTMKLEYVVGTEDSKEIISLQRFMDELGKKKEMESLYTDI